MKFDRVLYIIFFFFFKQKTAYEMRISDWSSDVCSSDLRTVRNGAPHSRTRSGRENHDLWRGCGSRSRSAVRVDTYRTVVRRRYRHAASPMERDVDRSPRHGGSMDRVSKSSIARCSSPHAFPDCSTADRSGLHGRSEEHTSELQSLMRISYAVFCLKNKR